MFRFQVCRHPGVEAIDFCELDSMVCDVAKQFFGESTATCFGDKRCNLVSRHCCGGMHRQTHTCLFYSCDCMIAFD